MFQDLRFAARMLVSNRGFTTVAALTLALGLGAGAAMFSVVRAVLLKPFPYADPGALVRVWEKRAAIEKGRVSWADYADWRTQSRSFEALAAYNTGDYNLAGAPDPEQVQGAAVTSNLFPILRAAPLLGRAFSREDEKPGAPSVVILSFGLWQRRFAGDRNVTGKTIAISDTQYTILGVMPRQFFFPRREVELWEPLALDPHSRMAGRGMHILETISRLRPGTSLEQARSEMRAIAARLERQYPRENSGHGVALFPMLEDATSGYRSSLLALFGAVGFLLAIACANVANLQLSRAADRRREVAIRSALGGGRARIARQLLIETLLLALAGAALGLPLAQSLLHAIVTIAPATMARVGESQLDPTALAFTLFAAVLTGIAFGLAPALHLSGADLAGALKDSTRGVAAHPATRRMRAGFVILQVAASLVLLSGAGLLLKSFILLQHVDPGFQTANVLTAAVNLHGSRFRPAQRQVFLEKVLDRLRAAPGVIAAGAVTHLPLAGNGPSFDFDIADRPPASPGAENKAQIRCITPAYFRAMGIALLAGRAPSPADSASAPAVLVVNDVMAERYFPGESPLGKRISFDKGTGGDPVWREIVGVVRGVRHSGLESAPEPQMYTPFSQFSMPFATFVIRTAGNPLALASAARGAVASATPTLPVFHIRSMEQVLEDSTAPRRFSLFLLACFALIAAGLASVGIYGVLSHAVAQRRMELGIRMALGAGAGSLHRLVIAEGMRLALAGVALGAIAAAALTRALASLLYGVSALDPAVFALTAALLLAVALAASAIPARRATRLDPLSALRAE